MPNVANLSNDVIISRLAEGSTGATSISEAVDMQNCAGVVFVGNCGTTGSALTLTIAHGASTTGFVNVSGGTHSSTAGNSIGGIDVYKPQKRYVRATLSTTASSRIQLLAIQYGCRNLQSSSTNVTLLVSPSS